MPKDNVTLAISAEFQKELASLRLEFGNLNHLRLAESLKKIAKLEKEKPTPKVRKAINDLKKSILYLIKMDF